MVIALSLLLIYFSGKICSKFFKINFLILFLNNLYLFIDWLLQFNFGNFQTQEKYGYNDKTSIFGNQFNKISNNNFNDINDKYNSNENEYENKNENINNESDPFQLNFNSFSNDNILCNENEREMTNHENDFIKLSANI